MLYFVLKAGEDVGDDAGVNPPEVFPEEWEDPDDDYVYWSLDPNGVWRLNNTEYTEEEECVDR